MKRAWIFLVIVAGSLLAFEDSGRLYIELDQVIFDPTGMYIEADGYYHPFDALVFDKDEGKYYSLKKEAKWKCGNCGKYNDPKKNNCWYCGWPWGPP